MDNLSESSLELSAATARRIGDDMMRVALADGDVHPRERALIDAFRAEVPEHAEGADFSDPEVRRAYVHSLVLVALADGVVSPEERVLIAKLAGEHGVSAAQVEAQILQAKLWFLDQFSGVTIFRDAVDQIAADLGLTGGTTA